MRHPCVAGQFYPKSAQSLERAVSEYLNVKVEKKEQAVAIIAPHAGYIYSGAVAGTVYASVKVPELTILLGPNHTGLGEKASVSTYGKWDTPLGEVEVDNGFVDLLLKDTELFQPDDMAHAREHSLEVQLPFLQAVNPETRIVAITLMHGSYVSAKEMGEHLSKVIKEYGKETLIAVSSDMNHYESEEETNKKDKLAIEEILKLDAEQLMSVTEEKDISMCGVFPAAVAIEASKILGATKARLISHATSGDVSGDKEQVVGYAGFLIK